MIVQEQLYSIVLYKGLCHLKASNRNNLANVNNMLHMTTTQCKVQFAACEGQTMQRYTVRTAESMINYLHDVYSIIHR